METFALQLKEELLKQSLLNHPYYQLWNEGKLSVENIKDYAKQYFTHEANLRSYIEGAMRFAPTLEARDVLLENHNDEETHPQLWLDFCKGLGAEKSEVLAEKAIASTQNLVEEFKTICGTSWASALGCLFAQEHNYSEISVSKKEGLAKFYGIDSEEAVKFFEVHTQADVWHTEQLSGLLNNLSEAQKQEATAAGKRAMAALNGFLDGIMKEYNLHAC